MDRPRRMPTPLLAVLAASLLANLVLLRLLLRPPQRPDVSGAYALGTEVSTLTEDDRYLVMYDDGGYLLYQRYQVLDSGRYSVEDEKGTRLCFTSDRGQGSYLVLFARRIPSTSPTGTPASGYTVATWTPPRLSLGRRRLSDNTEKGRGPDIVRAPPSATPPASSPGRRSR